MLQPCSFPKLKYVTLTLLAKLCPEIVYSTMLHLMTLTLPYVLYFLLLFLQFITNFPHFYIFDLILFSYILIFSHSIFEDLFVGLQSSFEAACLCSPI